MDQFTTRFSIGLWVKGATTSSTVLVENRLERDPEEPDKEDALLEADPDDDALEAEPDELEADPEADDDEDVEEVVVFDKDLFTSLMIFLYTIVVDFPVETGISDEKSWAFSVLVSDVFLMITVFFRPSISDVFQIPAMERTEGAGTTS